MRRQPSEADVREALATLNRRGRSRSKYRNVPTKRDGITFHSGKEADYWSELRLRERAGEVRRIRRQPRYALFAAVIHGASLDDANAGLVSQRRHPVGDYVADFDFEERGRTQWHRVVVDVKGVRTAIYKLKKRIFEAQYGVTIREV